MEVLTPILDSLEFPIDFEGQKAASKIIYLLAGAAAIVSLVVSIVFRDLSLSVFIFFGFFVIAMIATLPSYSSFNENPVKFSKRPVSKKIEIDL